MFQWIYDFGLGYGDRAFLMASHICLSVALMLLMWRIFTMLDGAAPQIAIGRGLMFGFLFYVWGQFVERIYYVAAHFLVPFEYDLWNLHPAPEILSIGYLASVYAVKVPLIFSQYPKDRARSRVLKELTGLVALWCAVILVVT